MQNTNRNDKLYIRTYREIRKYIVQNNLQPGDLLPTEQKLCETLGVSRNVLRESIKSMELMGMVRACPGKGTEVQAFNLDFILQNVLFFQVGPQEEHSIREMFGVRKVLELAYMRQAFHAMTEEDVRALRSLADAMRDSSRELSQSYTSFVENISGGLSRTMGLFEENMHAVVSLLDGKLESIEKTAKTAQSAYTDKADRLNAGTDGLLSALSQLQRALGDMTRSVQAAGDALGEKADKEG